jgi:hypothetical protein
MFLEYCHCLVKSVGMIRQIRIRLKSCNASTEACRPIALQNKSAKVHSHGTSRSRFEGPRRSSTACKRRIAIARLLPGKLHQLRAQLRIAVRRRLVTIIEPVKNATACRLCVRSAGNRSIRTQCPLSGRQAPPVFPDDGLQHFLMQAQSATECFRLWFSSSIGRKRCASLTSRPPYFDFQA